METDGSVALFQRSIKANKLGYTTYIGDGESKSYSAVSNSQPYGPLVNILKEECVSHITKRMGTGLRDIVNCCKGMSDHVLKYPVLLCLIIFYT